MLNEYGWSVVLEYLNIIFGCFVVNIGYTKAALEFFRDVVGCAVYLSVDV